MNANSALRGIVWLIAGVGSLNIAAPAMAQAQATAPTPEEIIITGRYGRVPESVRSLSQAISYADLDLSIEADRRELRNRINLTARYLCEKLGESTTTTSVSPSCRDDAVKNATERLGTLEANFAPRGTTWVRGPAWQPPYPPTWVTK